MDWPVDMPFPVFYKKWQVYTARLSGLEPILRSKGMDLNWDNLRALNKQSQQDPRWPQAFLNSVGGQNEAAVMLEQYMLSEDCRTFLLSKNLIDALKKTKVSDVPADLIKIPFGLIYIDISSSPIKLNAPDHVSESVRGIFVPSYDQKSVEKVYPGAGQVVSGLLAEYAPGDTDGPGGPICNWNCESLSWRAENGVFQASWDGGGVTSALEDRPDLQEVWGLWINALLYINSVNADVREEWLYRDVAAKMKGTKGKRKRDRRRYVESGGKVFRVGHYIHIPQTSEGERKAHQGGKVGVRFMVRGHWHTYWVGSNRFGNREQKLKWLAPYWKGPEAADVVHGTYMVNQPKEEDGNAEEKRGEGLE